LSAFSASCRARWRISAELDRETGLLADELTPEERRYTEYFLNGTEPEELRPSPWKLFGVGRSFSRSRELRGAILACARRRGGPGRVNR
jgi:hypothetical protein